MKGREKAQGMNEIAKTVFAPIYPVIAEDIISQCGTPAGLCIDLGSGPGQLSIALADLLEDPDILLLDSSSYVQEIAKENVNEAGISNNLTPLTCDLHNIPLKESSVRLAISRGSIFFWDDPSGVLMEVYRVLSRGGRSYIGGGFGNDRLKQSVFGEMARKNPEWPAFTEKNLGHDNRRHLVGIVQRLGIPFRIHEDNAGFWIIISK